MTAFLIEQIEIVAALAPVWGFALVLFFMTVESSFIPFPSEVVMIPAGFLAARGELSLQMPSVDLFLVIFMGTVGSLLGAWVNYVLARRLGQPFLLRYGKYVFLPPEKLARAEEIFRQYGAGATFVCRMLPAIRQLISIPAGIAGMNAKSFTIWTGLGAGIWVTVLALMGYTAGLQTQELTYAELVHQGKTLIRQNLVWLIPVLGGGLLAYVWISRKIMGQQPATALPYPAD